MAYDVGQEVLFWHVGGGGDWWIECDWDHTRPSR
jgi:hypothetical protein